MVRLLPSRPPGLTAAEVKDRLDREGHPVTKRTVERDLQELSRNFGVQCNDASTPWGWYRLPNAQNELGGVEVTEAVSLTLAESVLRQLLPPSMLSVLEPKFALARKKLQAVGKLPLAQWGQKVRYVPDSLPLRPAKTNPKVVETVQTALIEDRQLEVRYEAFRSKGKDLRLQPIALIQRGPTTYLIASVFDYPDPLRFALHRIKRATLLDTKVAIGSRPSVDDLLASGLMEFGEAEVIRLEALVNEDLATYLAETPLSDDQHLSHENGHWQVTATVRQTWQLEFWLLSQCASITVSSPEALRRNLLERLQTAVRQYQQTPKS